MITSASEPIKKATSGLLNLIPSTPSSPANMPTTRNVRSSGAPSRLETTAAKILISSSEPINSMIPVMLAKFYLLGHDALDPYNNSQIQSTGEKFMQELVLATGNKGKVSELEGLLQPLGWQVKPQSQWNFDEVEETGLTFVENAILKARHAAQQTGLPALADDSGL